MRPTPRVACLWVVPGGSNWPYYFDLTAYTLLVHDMKWRLDLHVLTPVIPETYIRGEKSRWPFLDRAYFHRVTNEDWQRRVYQYLGVNISYPLNNHKKVADFKPMYAHLFPDIVTDVYDYWVYGDYDGFFGSYDSILNYDHIALYEVMSGYSIKTDEKDSVDYNGNSHHVLGSWSMFRNNHKVNTLFKRSMNYVQVIKNEKFQYSFDENTHKSATGEESFHEVIGKSIDVTRCCIDNKQPSIRQNLEDKIVMDLKGDYIREGVSFSYKWEKNEALKASLDGHIGIKKIYKKHNTSALFIHFLQWKFVRPRLFHESLRKFIDEVLALENKYMSLSCFELAIHSHNIETTELLYSYRICPS